MLPHEFSHLCKMLFCSANLLVLGVDSAHASEKIASLYSRLNGASCSLESVEKKTGASITRCEGVGGIQLLVQNDDERASISVVDLRKTCVGSRPMTKLSGWLCRCVVFALLAVIGTTGEAKTFRWAS
jgi:hypothetical protein